MSTPGSPPAESAIAGYTIREVIGRGATAVVYRATRPGGDEPVALKVIAPDARRGDDGQERFEREARLAAAVVHRGILPVYEVGEDQGRPFVAMRLAPGDLAAAIRGEGGLPPARAVALVSQLAAALDAAHAHGLVHRDVKPSNVLLDEEEGEERAYLADFGVARTTFSGDGLLPGELVGTVGYASPEQIRGEPVDHRTDVYALGCLLYECLTGRVPYASRDALATLWGHLHDEPPAPSVLVSAVPPALDAAVGLALAKSPAARYGSAGELAEAAGAALERRRRSSTTGARPRRKRTNPAAPPSGFLGREEQLSAAEGLMREARLLTVTGPGGAGKTRFALELASRARTERRSDYDGGVYACFLAPLRDPALVLPTVARALALAEQPGTGVVEALSARIGSRGVLLLLDNLEHLPGAAAELAELLAACPTLTLLVTSRERLRLDAETAYDLPPLLPDEGVALFCDRAACNPSAPIAELCSRLEGLPLAIELAAARTSLLSPRQLLARLSERLDLLAADDRDADPRQRTLRATIEWSYDLLTPEAQTSFARLSVFAGGCTLAAAEAVCDTDEDALRSLLDKSLLRRSGERYWMLETIRELAAEALERSGEREALGRRHAEHFAELAEQTGPDARGRSPAIFDELARDDDNYRAALQWASMRGDAVVLGRIAGALAMYWNTRGPYAEARAWLESIDDGPLDHRLGALVARGLGAICAQQGDFERSSWAYERALTLARRAGDRDLECACLGNLAVAAIRLSDPARARQLLTECRALARALGDELKLARAANTLGVLALEEGGLAEAEAAFEESLAAAERVGELESIMIAATNLGSVAYRAGRSAEAARRFRDGLLVAEKLEFPTIRANYVTNLAAVEARDGDPVRAARLLGIAETILHEAGVELEPHMREHESETRASIREQLGEEAAAQAFAAGRSLERAEALAYALEEADGPETRPRSRRTGEPRRR